MLTLTLVIVTALAFDFTNGFHDAANAVATSVATGSIRPRLAVALAGVLNFAGAFASIKVASTIGKGIIDPGRITLDMILAGLLGAIVWNLATWWLGLPSSSSHALVGGVAGAAIAGGGGVGIVKWSGLYHKVLLPSMVAPLLGFALAAALVIALGGPIRRWLERRPRPGRVLQLTSAGFVAFTHGTNDAQKTMGVIALALLAGGKITTFHVPDWVIVASALAMALGTYVGGWRIVQTLGSKLQALDLRTGAAAQTSAGIVLYLTAAHGYPVSTTQTVTGSVLGTGVAHRFKLTRWSLGGRIAMAWIITLPSAAAIGALCTLILRVPGGVGIVVVAMLVALAAAWRQRARLLSGGWDEVAGEARGEAPQLPAMPAAA